MLQERPRQPQQPFDLWGLPGKPRGRRTLLELDTIYLGEGEQGKEVKGARID